jgi:DeoR/GlpR family transcriptional regulator of sugar metabolism
MLKIERQKAILNQLQLEKKLTTLELATLFNVSEDTIRRDLNELKKSGQINKVYGAAFLSDEQQDITITNPQILKYKEKEVVAQKALQHIKEGQVIIMSGGTTNLVLARMLPRNLNATIYTYSLPIAMELAKLPNIELMFIGGKIQKNAMVTVGIDVLQYLSGISADICFMGVSSINVKNGLTEKGYEVSMIKKEMMKSSDTTICLLTSDKLNKKMTYSVCSLQEIDFIISDINSDHPYFEDYKKLGVLTE